LTVAGKFSASQDKETQPDDAQDDASREKGLLQDARRE
jgi:hypothetical protein